jgi:hypothetical protein
MTDQRQARREPSVGVTAFVHQPGGAVLEGVVQNVSDKGMKLVGDTSGLKIGDAVDIIAVVQGERVKFACEIKHVDPAGHSLGVIFRSGPQSLAAPPAPVRRCMNCRRDFDPECRFCSQCGQKLLIR